MEHINKEQLAEESAQEYASRFYDYTNSDRKWDASKVNYQNGYLAGFNQAEEIYSKKLEEKDNKIIKIAQNLANLQDDLGEEYFPEALNKRLPNCPLDKEQIIVSL